MHTRCVMHSALLAAWLCLPAPAPAADAPQAAQVAEAHRLAQLPPVPPPHGHRIVPDPSGRKQSGHASVYAGKFQGRKMADGGRFSQAGDSAASKTLPLGTVAKVTNVKTGQTAMVVVRDHGPFVDGQTVDLTRHTAGELGITRKEGIAPVVVAPVSVPQPGGGAKLGAGAVPGPATAQ